MKKLTLCAGLFLICLSPVLAQQPNRAGTNRAPMASRPAMQERLNRSANAPSREEKMEKLQSAKIGFITQKMNLNPKEAEKFWPIYNQYQNELKNLAQQRKAGKKEGVELSADQRLADQLEMESDLLELRKKYTKEFSRVVPSEKVVDLYEAEKQFRQELVKELQNRRKN